MYFKLHIGDWKANIGTCSLEVEDLSNKVVNVFRCLHSESKGDSIKGDEAYLAICTPKIIDWIEIPKWLPVSEYNDWRNFIHALKSVLSHIRRGDSSGSPVYCWPPLEINEPRNNKKKTQISVEGTGRFFAFVMDQPDDHCRIELMLHILFLATQWHVERGGLSIHASAVAKGEKGFLFLGQSEAGKTTAARLSSQIGYSPLGDDVNFIIDDGENGYRLTAGPTLSGRTMEHSLQRPELCGIFSLIQDERDYLVPLSQMSVAQKLVDGLGQVPFYADLSGENIEKAFQTCCTIARQIPGYELHFRKSPDFWNVINEQFPD